MPEVSQVTLKENYLVTVHRRFAEAVFDTPLTLYELRILYAVISNIEPPVFLKDEENNFVLDKDNEKIITNYVTELPVFEMHIKEFGELIGLKEIEYRIVRKVMRDFKKKGLEIHRLDRSDAEIDERDYRGINFLMESEYIHREGMIRVEFSPKLLPYVANLTREFVTVPLGTITRFDSKYSSKLFLMMQQWKTVKRKEFRVDDLKGVLGVPFEMNYKNGKETRIFKLEKYNNFKSRALEPAVKEINEHTDLKVQFEEIKVGKRVTKILFTIQEKEKTKKKEIQQTENENGSISVQSHLIKEVFGDIQFGKAFFKNMEKHLYSINKLDSKRDLEFEVYKGLLELKSYFLSQTNNLGEGFIINELKVMVENYHASGEFSYRTGKSNFTSENSRVEILPEWFTKERKKTEDIEEEQIHIQRKEFENTQGYTVLRKESDVILAEEPQDSLINGLEEELGADTSEDKKKVEKNFDEEKQDLLKRLALKKKKSNK